MLPRKTILVIWVVFGFVIKSYAGSIDVFVPLPDRCVQLERQEANKVFLRSSESCLEYPIVKLSLDSSIEGVDIYLDGKLVKTYTVKDKLLEESIKKANDERAEQLARQVYEYTLGEEFRKKVEQYSKQLKDVFSPSWESIQLSYYPQLDRAPFSGFSSTDRIYVFVSSSVPQQTVRAYVRDLEKLSTKVTSYMVLRGALGGLKFIMPTVRWITEALKKDPHCDGECDIYSVKFLIDPFLFRKFSIERVPAVVYARGVSNNSGLSEGLLDVGVTEFWVSYGDVSLSYHLKLISESSGVKELLNESVRLESGAVY